MALQSILGWDHHDLNKNLIVLNWSPNKSNKKYWNTSDVGCFPFPDRSPKTSLDPGKGMCLVQLQWLRCLCAGNQLQVSQDHRQRHLHAQDEINLRRQDWSHLELKKCKAHSQTCTRTLTKCLEGVRWPDRFYFKEDWRLFVCVFYLWLFSSGVQWSG